MNKKDQIIQFIKDHKNHTTLKASFIKFCTGIDLDTIYEVTVNENQLPPNCTKQQFIQNNKDGDAYYRTEPGSNWRIHPHFFLKDLK